MKSEVTEIDIDDSATVLDIKQKMHDICGFDVDAIHLLHKGTQLKDEQKISETQLVCIIYIYLSH